MIKYILSSTQDIIAIRPPTTYILSFSLEYDTHIWGDAGICFVANSVLYYYYLSARFYPLKRNNGFKL